MIFEVENAKYFWLKGAGIFLMRCCIHERFAMNIFLFALVVHAISDIQNVLYVFNGSMVIYLRFLMKYSIKNIWTRRSFQLPCHTHSGDSKCSSLDSYSLNVEGNLFWRVPSLTLPFTCSLARKGSISDMLGFWVNFPGHYALFLSLLNLFSEKLGFLLFNVLQLSCCILQQLVHRWSNLWPFYWRIVTTLLKIQLQFLISVRKNFEIVLINTLAYQCSQINIL